MTVTAYNSELDTWRSVPDRVASLLPVAAKVRKAHERASVKSAMLNVSNATWQPDKKLLHVYTQHLHTKAAKVYEQHLPKGIGVEFHALSRTPDWDKEIFVKRGTGIPLVTPAWEYGNMMLGGPNPLTNGIVAALMGAGLGYGGGALIENMFPERYIERGKLRKTLAALGGLGGVGLGVANAARNAKIFNTGILDGALINNNTQVPYMTADQVKEELHKNKATQGVNGVKAGSMYGAYDPLRTTQISVPQFNNAVWRDVQKGFNNNSFAPSGLHTPPQTAAMATGIMSGIGSAQRSSIISPANVISGIASAGVGLATANIAGRALGALAGLTPAAQNKLQDMGLFAGMLHAIVPPILGIR